MSECRIDPQAGEDRLLASIEAVQHAAETAIDALEPVRAGLDRARNERLMAVPLPMIVDSYLTAGGQDARHSAAAALQAYEQAFMRLRAETIRELVDGHGYTLTEVAGTLSVSRQMVARLLEAGRSGTFAGG